jgi:membrane fusion protein (multidrug efflux system)
MGYSGPIDTLGATHAADPKENAAERRIVWRRRLLFGFFILLLIGVSAWGVHLFNDHIRYVSTDDAYVDAQVAAVAPQVDGTILQVAVNDTQMVKRGDLLVRLDPTDAQLAVDAARANYEQAERHVQQNLANVGAAHAIVAARQSDLARATLDFDRRNALARTGAVSGDEVSTARNALENAKSALSYAEQALAAQQALVAGGDIRQNPEVRAANAALDKALLDLKRTEIRSPLDGIVAQNLAQIGQLVTTGAPLMTVVPVRQAYVNANFKEVQLDRIHPGQRVTLTSDLYGSGTVFHGRVAGVGGGTGAAFALIPAQNATGNWIKVVQRLPVRIALDPVELAKKPLRVGLSMTVTVDLEPFRAVPRLPAKKPLIAKPKKAPAAKIALQDFVIDPLSAAKPIPQASSDQASSRQGHRAPLLRTVVDY